MRFLEYDAMREFGETDKEQSEVEKCLESNYRSKYYYNAKIFYFFITFLHFPSKYNKYLAQPKVIIPFSF